jgi:hypothetical protein
VSGLGNTAAGMKKNFSGDNITSLSNTGTEDMARSRAKKMTSGSRFDAVIDNIEKLFDERIEFFGVVDMHRFGIWTAIARIIIKVLILFYIFLTSFLNLKNILVLRRGNTAENS